MMVIITNNFSASRITEIATPLVHRIVIEQSTGNTAVISDRIPIREREKYIYFRILVYTSEVSCLNINYMYVLLNVVIQ